MGDSDPGRDIYPVKEVMTPSKHLSGGGRASSKDDGRTPTQSNERQRTTVLKWARHELEDHYFHVYEENLILKKHAHRQEDKIKRMTTKLVRLTNDRKKQELDGRGDPSAIKKRDVEMEQLVEEQQDRLRELERQNKLLQDKLVVIRQQLATQLKRPVSATYRHISSRTDSGLPRFPVKPGSALPVTGRVSQYPFSSYAPSPDVVEKGDVINDSSFAHLRDKLDAYEQEILILKEQLQARQSEHEEEILSIKSQLTNDQRQMLHENISLIRLQRDLKQKSSQLMALEAEYTKQEEDYEHLIANFDTLNYQLKEEQERNSSLQSEIASLATSNMMIAECKEKITDLEKENQILRDSNNKLIENALDYEKLTPVRSEVPPKAKMPQFDTFAKFTLDRSDVLREELDNERGLNQKLQEELRQVRTSLQQLDEQRNELTEKLQFFTKADVNVTEFQEAFAIVHERREKALHSELCQQSEEDDSRELLRKDLVKVQADHAETIIELEKVRDMLVVQHRINRDYQQEIEKLADKLGKAQYEYEDRLVEQNRLLEQRSVRIQHLERQLKDMAYGTTQYKIDHTQQDDSNRFRKSVDPSADENLFEIHVHKLQFSKEGLNVFKDMEPKTFVTWAFFHYERQSTPVITGVDPEYDFTARYVVSVDDVFLDYLNRQKVTIELHRADFVKVAQGQMGISGVLDGDEGRLKGTMQLIGVRDGESGIIFGILEFWIRFHVSIEQSMAKYKERSKTLGYIRTDVRLANKAVRDEAVANSGAHVNELHVKVLRCRGLTPVVEGMQPSSYCVYKFYSKPDHDTAIITSSSNPEFHDHSILHVSIDLQLDRYLRTKSLEIFVFDDNDPDLTSYLGMAAIPLQPLAHNETIQGTFELRQANGHPNGTVDVSLYWQYKYISTGESVFSGTLQTTEENKLKSSANDDTVNPECDTEKTASLPTPKPRTMKVVHVSHDETLQELNKKPPIAPRDTLKATGRMMKALQTSPRKSSPDHNGHVVSSSSDSSSDDDTYVVSRSAGRTVLTSNAKMATSNGNATCSQSPEIEQATSYDYSSNTESDGDVIVVPSKTVEPENTHAVDTVVILISHLSFTSNAALLHDDAIQMLFVEYRFLDFAQEELETPFALPKPAANQKILYNFRKVFHLDVDENKQRCQLFSDMISSSSTEKNRIKFTVVSEPSEDNSDLECEDVGYAFVDLKKIAESKRDLMEEDIDVFGVNNETTIIGHINISIQAVAAMNHILGKKFLTTNTWKGD